MESQTPTSYTQEVFKWDSVIQVLKRRILKCSAVLKLSKSGQSKLVNALHPSAVKGSNEASCHSAKADLTTSITALRRRRKKKERQDLTHVSRELQSSVC